MLTSQARESLRGVETVIVDEVHAVAGTKRGAHLALSPRAARRAARPAGPADRPVRDRAPDRGGRPLPRRRRAGRGRRAAVGEGVGPQGRRAGRGHDRARRASTTSSRAGRRRRRARASIWPHVEERVVDLIEQHRSTIVFANSRRLAERLTARLNEIAAERARRARRAPTPADRRAPPAADDGAVAASRDGADAGHRPRPPRLGLQGAAGAHRGRPQARPAALRGRHLQPRARHRHGRGRPGRPDRVAAVGRQRPAAGRPRRPPGRRGLARRAVPQAPRRPGARPRSPSSGCARARIEALHVPANPLDVLAQQVVAATALDAWDVDELFDARTPRRAVRDAARGRRTTRRSTCSAGRYPSDEFAELRPRLVWDRVAGDADRPARAPSGWPSPAAAPSPTAGCSASSWSGRRPSPRSASSTRRWSTSPGSATCSRSARRAGGSRTSPTTGCWSRPRPASPGGCRSGRATRSAGPPSSARRSARSPASSPRCRREQAPSALHATPASTPGPPTTWSPSSTSSARRPARCPPTARSWSSGSATSSATGGSSCTRPTARRCTRPWALAINARLRERYGIDAQAMAADDGIVLRIPETDQDPPGADADRLRARRDRADRHHRGRRLGAVRLPVPRVRGPGAAAAAPRPRPALAAVAAAAAQRRSCSRSPRKYPSFPIVLETVREVPAGRLRPAGAGRADAAASPRARGPARRGRHPRSRRRSPGRCCSATSRRSCTRATPRSPSAGPPRSPSTRGCSPSCSAGPSCASCSTPRCSPRSRRELQRLADDRRARDAEGVADLLRLLGPLVDRRGRGALRRRRDRRRPTGCRCSPTRAGWSQVRMAGDERWAVVEDVARLRDGARRAGAAGRPRRVHRAGRRPARRPGRPLRPHPRPVHRRRRRRAARPRRRGRPPDAGRGSPRQGRVLEGEFRPAGAGRRVVRRRGAAPAAAPVARRAAPGGRAGRAGDARPVPAGLAARRARAAAAARASTACVTVVEQLAGCAVPASALESLVLPAPGRATTSPRCSTSSPPPARCSGPATARCPAPTAGSRCTSPTPRRLTLPDRGELELDAAARGGRSRRWRRRRVLLPPARRRASASDRRQGAVGGAVGPGLGRPGRQRHPRPAAGADLAAAAAPTGSRRPPPRARDRAAAAAAPALPTRTGPPTTAGRWFLLPDREPDATRRAHAVGRGAARAARRGHPRRGDERARAGRLRRRLQGALRVRGDRPLPARLLRRRAGRRPVRRRRRRRPAALAHPRRRATGAEKPERARAGRDRPGQPLRRRLPWPEPRGEGAGHRPGRKAGALVVLVDGELVLYVERGGRTLLTFTDDRGDCRRPAHPGVRRPRRRRTPRARSAGSPSRRPTASSILGAATGARAAPGAGGGRLRGHPARAEAACLRATPSGAPAQHARPGAGRRRCSPRATSGCPRSPPSTSPAHRSPRRVSRGKHLLTRFDTGDTLHTHLKMEGPGTSTARVRRWRRPAHEARVVLTGEEWIAVGFALGVVELVRTDGRGHRRRPPGSRPARPRLGRRRGRPAARRRPRPALGEALLDQRNLAGIGNMYKSELCFLAGHHPSTPVGAVGDLSGSSTAPTGCSSSTANAWSR